MCFSGDLGQAVTRAAEAALAEPDNTQRALDLAKLLVLQQRYAQADDLLKSLPASMREQAEVRNLSAHVGLIRAAQESPPLETLEQAIAENPDDLEARYRLSAVKITRDDNDGAMEQLLEIVHRNHAFRNQVGHNGLLAIFVMLGENDERVLRYRALLNQALH